MCAILSVVLLICAAGTSLAVDVATCSNATGSQMTFTPYNDEVVGRYLLKLCKELPPGTSSWRVSLQHYNNESYCSHRPYHGIDKPGKTHSTYEQKIVIEGNCSNVCLNTTFDLVFSSCYSIDNSFIVDGHPRLQNYTYFNIKNKYTKDHFLHNKAAVDVRNIDDENVTINWHTGVPFLSFEISICKILNSTMDTEEEEGACLALTAAQCAAPSALELRCRAALAAACYKLRLTLHAPWMHGVLRDQNIVPLHYCKEKLPPPTATVGGSLLWAWALGAGAAVCAACVGARAACRSRALRALHKEVQREWRLQSGSGLGPSAAAGGPAAAPAPAPGPSPRHTLLLYAREGPAAARLSAALRALLEQAPGTKVYDIFDPEVMALAAAAPAEWVRGLLRRHDVRVVLLQTPALACLYRGTGGGGGTGTKLYSPLLGRRMVYRAPQYGDSLLQYAVRLTSEAAAAHSNYRKYYIATLSELPTEVFPQLVPYRRYPLPGAAALLYADVSAPAGTAGTAAGVDAAPAGALAAVSAAARAFADHARDNPNYLMDELMII